MALCIGLTSIDWSLTKDIVTIIGTGAAITIGYFGLSTWRRQQQGTSEYEISKKAILKTYELQLTLQSVRNPMIHLNAAEVQEGRRIEEEQKIYQDRFESLTPIRAELQAIGLEAKVLWGDEARNCFESLNKVVAELSAGVWMHFWLKGAYAGPAAIVDSSPERIAESDKIVYYISEEDEFSIKIHNAVLEVEKYFQPKMRGR